MSQATIGYFVSRVLFKSEDSICELISINKEEKNKSSQKTHVDVLASSIKEIPFSKANEELKLYTEGPHEYIEAISEEFAYDLVKRIEQQHTTI